MSLLSQPGILARDLVFVQPVRRTPGEDPDTSTPTYEPVGSLLRAYARKLGAGESFREGKQDQTVSYRVYIDYRRGQTYAFGEKDRIWVPGASDTLADGTPNYETALDINSIVTYNPPEGVAVIEAGRTY